jgi:hypothetical protein
MSASIISPATLVSAPGADVAAAGQSAVKLFRAGVHRGRDFASIVSDLNDTYNVIEAWCMVTAAAFATVMIVAAFGLRF